MLTKIAISILAALFAFMVVQTSRRLLKHDRLAAQRRELRKKKEMLYERLTQTVYVYLRERESPVPDALLMRNDRDLMRSLINDLDDVNKLLRETERG